MVDRQNSSTDQTALAVGWILPSKSYLWIPQRLIERLYAVPLALALYAIYVRLWIAWDRPGGLPLSDADLLTYCPSFSNRATLIKLQHLLIDWGYLIKDSTGKKNRYTPAWGRDHHGHPRPWVRGAKEWNRRSTRTVQLNTLLIDCYVGRLFPTIVGKAHVQTYLKTPLSVHALGAAMLTLRSFPIADRAAQAELEARGLLNADGVLSVPSRPEILAREERTERGTRRLTHDMLKPAESPCTPVHYTPDLLAYCISLTTIALKHLTSDMTPDVTPDVTPHVIQTDPDYHANNAALGATKPAWASDCAPTAMTPWNLWMVWMLCMIKGIPPTPQQRPLRAGGQNHSDSDTNPPTPESIQKQQQSRSPRQRTIPTPDTDSILMSNETSALLHAADVSAERIAELAHLDPAIVASVLRATQAGQWRSPAGRIVSVLRCIRDLGWDVAAQRFGLARPQTPESCAEAFARYFPAAPPQHTDPPHMASVAPHNDEPNALEQIAPRHPSVTADQTADLPAWDDDPRDELPETPADAVMAFRHKCARSRALQRIAAAITIREWSPRPLADHPITLYAETPDAFRVLHAESGVVRQILGELADLRPEYVQVQIRRAAIEAPTQSLPSSPRGQPIPAWIDPATWAQLPPTVQGLLSDSRRDGPCLTVASAFAHRQLTNHPSIMDTLEITTITVAPLPPRSTPRRAYQPHDRRSTRLQRDHG